MKLIVTQNINEYYMIGIGVGLSFKKRGSSLSSYWLTNYISTLSVLTTSDTTQTVTATIVGTGYDGLEFSYSSDGQITWSAGITDADGILNQTGLSANTFYHWRVRLYKGINYSPYFIYFGITYPSDYLTWYLRGAVAAANAIAVYKPTGAANLAASYVNLKSPGTYDITTVAAPTWDAVNGWKFDGATQYLKTGVVPIGIQTWSMVVKFSEYTAGVDCIAGLYETATKTFAIYVRDDVPSKMGSITTGGGAVNIDVLPHSKGILTLTGRYGFFDGRVASTAAASSGAVPSYDIWIGQIHYTSSSGWFDGNVQALTIYNKALNNTETFELTQAMQATCVNKWIRDEYLAQKFGALICFTLGSFTNTIPEIDGDPNDFNPSDLDIDQWLDACVAAGMRYAALTVKEEGGFCLWPTLYAAPAHDPYSIAESAWYAANGSPDIVDLFITKCREHHLRVGLYFGVMDLTWEARTGKDETTDAAGYIAMIKTQLSEILTNYGAIDFLWIDSWEMRIGYEEIPFITLYDYVKNIQPNCVVLDNTHDHPALTSEVEIYEPTGGDPVISAGNTRISEEVWPIRNDPSWYYDSTKDQTATALYTKAEINAARAQCNSRNGTYLLGITPDTTGHLPAAQKTILESL